MKGESGGYQAATASRKRGSEPREVFTRLILWRHAVREKHQNPSGISSQRVTGFKGLWVTSVVNPRQKDIKDMSEK